MQLFTMGTALEIDRLFSVATVYWISKYFTALHECETAFNVI